MATAIEVHPVTPERWADLEKLFGPSGAYGGCWCMYFRMRSSDNARAKGSERKASLKALVATGPPPGLIAYLNGEPAGWVSLDARERFTMLRYSRMYKPVDDRPVWTIVCFVVGRGYRRHGMMGRLLQGAIGYARDKGAGILEAYPVESPSELKGYAGYMGIRSVFDRAGFKEVARLANGRPVLRKVLG
jgi:GNAT superfamily N-acetyltransferase